MISISRRFSKRHFAPLLGLGAALLLLAAFMSIWSSTRLKTESFGLEVVQAFGTVLVALSALYAGALLRSRQEEAADAKAQLALNVELKSRVIQHESSAVIEVEARVKNVSSLSWTLPALYVFIHGIDVKQMKDEDLIGPLDIIPPDLEKLKGRNIARFQNSMVRLCPDEEDVYSCSFLISQVSAWRWPYYLVMAEAVGAPDSDNFDSNKRGEFIALLDGLFREGHIIELNHNETEEQRCARQVRHSYMLFESTEPNLSKKYGARILVRPPEQRTGPLQADRIDSQNSLRFKEMLADVMIWSRVQVVCVAGSQGGDRG